MEPVFNKVKETLMERLLIDDPKSLSMILDGWTAKCHGYIAYNATYLKNWKRVTFHVYCQPFDESHTAANIRASMEEHLTE